VSAKCFSPINEKVFPSQTFSISCTDQYTFISSNSRWKVCCGNKLKDTKTRIHSLAFAAETFFKIKNVSREIIEPINWFMIPKKKESGRSFTIKRVSKCSSSEKILICCFLLLNFRSESCDCTSCPFCCSNLHSFELPFDH